MPTYSRADSPYTPQSQSSLREILSITWTKGSAYPQGIQDCDGGIINNTLVAACGYSGGQTDVPGKADKYPWGWNNKTWGLDLSSPQNSWRSLPDFPGATRQELFGITVNNKYYCWGGYDGQNCFSDGYCLSQDGLGKWAWTAMPSLPCSVASSGICAVGSKIYVAGGSYLTNATNSTGNQLLSLDVNNPSAGWTCLAACPGTPRLVQAAAAVGGKVYMFGGAAGFDTTGTSSYATVVDNWVYDPASNHWSRLQDLPVASGNFPSGGIVYDDRYILLVGGYQYSGVMTPDGSLTSTYGVPTKHDPDYPYYSDIFVYDTQTGKFGTASSLPINNNLPMTVVNGNKLYMLGSECAGASGFDGVWFNGEPFGHDPDLFLIGTISAVPEPGAFMLLITAAVVSLLFTAKNRKDKSFVIREAHS